MVREISRINFGSVVTNPENRNVKAVKSKKKFASMEEPPKPLAKYSTTNLQANFLTFAGNINNKRPSKVNFGNTVPFSDSGSGPITDVSKLPFSKTFHTDYYEETADDLAILMGPDKSAVLTHEDDANTDLLMHKFYQNVKKGKYKNEGLDPEKTKIMILDSKALMKKGNLPHEGLGLAMSLDAGKPQVVFVKNFENFVVGLTQSGVDPVEFMDNLKLIKTKVVGLVPKQMHGLIKEGKTNVDVKVFKQLATIDLEGLNPKNTKDFFKNNRRLINQVTARYKDVKINVSDNAINALVDQSSVKIDGTFPNKALKVLDLALSAKMNEVKNHKDGTPIIIKSSDINHFFENHNNLIASLKPQGGGQFQIAENVKTKLSDVGGIKTIKENLEEGILAYLKDPKKFTSGGQKAPKGILMHGEPGTGKTLLARAIAGESGVPFIAASGSEFVEKYVGVGAQRVRELFENAKKAAANSEKKTAIVFIDEIDAIGQKRTGEGGGSSETEKTLNQLLTEMDGFNNKDSKIKIIVMAATNRADILDPALKRAGRFDDVIEVPAPSRDPEARFEILNIHAKGKPFADEASKAKILGEAAKITSGMSGAELAEVMNKAAKVVAKRSENKFITHNDIVEGYLQVVAGPVSKSDASNATKAMVVRHEGGHAVAIATLKKDDISFVTLDGRGEFLGAVFHQPSKEMPNFKSVIASLATSYAGGLAEPGYDINGHGAGVSGDLKNITGTIERALKKSGLGVSTPQLSFEDNSPLLSQYAKEIKKDTELFSKTGQKVAKLIVDFHKDFLDDYVKSFESNAGKGGNNLSGEEFVKLRQNWLVKTGKDKQLPKLEKDIAEIIHVAQNSNKPLYKLISKFI